MVTRAMCWRMYMDVIVMAVGALTHVIPTALPTHATTGLKMMVIHVPFLRHSTDAIALVVIATTEKFLQ